MATVCPSDVCRRTNSTARDDTPLKRPTLSADTTRPSTRAPRSAMTKPSATSSLSSVAVNESPGRFRSDVSPSTRRTGIRIPAFSVTLWGSGGAGGGGGGVTFSGSRRAGGTGCGAASAGSGSAFEGVGVGAAARALTWIGGASTTRGRAMAVGCARRGVGTARTGLGDTNGDGFAGTPVACASARTAGVAAGTAGVAAGTAGVAAGTAGGAGGAGGGAGRAAGGGGRPGGPGRSRGRHGRRRARHYRRRGQCDCRRRLPLAHHRGGRRSRKRRHLHDHRTRHGAGGYQNHYVQRFHSLNPSHLKVTGSRRAGFQFHGQC